MVIDFAGLLLNICYCDCDYPIPKMLGVKGWVLNSEMQAFSGVNLPESSSHWLMLDRLEGFMLPIDW